jgi:CheY-like chemotaxis protein
MGFHAERVHRGWVLVVDTSQVTRRTAARLLERLGYEVDVAATEREAVAAAAVCAYDFLLVDCQMTAESGRSLCEHLRGVLRRRGRCVPILALAPERTPGWHDRRRRAGTDDCVTKPLRSSDLAAKLGRWVAGRLGGPPIATAMSSR